MNRCFVWGVVVWWISYSGCLVKVWGKEDVLELAQQECEKKNDWNCWYRVCKEWKNQEDAIRVWKILAEEPYHHVPSMVQLGHTYASTSSSSNQAIHYFRQAVEWGNHPASMYNVGMLLAQQHDYVGAIAYIQAAATQTDDMTIQQTSQTALLILSKQISTLSLPLKQIADIFLYDHPLQDEQATQYWTNAILAAIQFNETFVTSPTTTTSPELYVTITSNLHALWQSSHQEQLSELQQYLVLDLMNDFIGVLAGMVDDNTNNEYVAAAGDYAQLLALNPLCYSHYAIVESDSACFNGAISSAVSYHRRASSTDKAQEAFVIGQSHPHASTKHWHTILQTPRVYHPTSTPSQPWWNAHDFSISNQLETFYQQHQSILLQELQSTLLAPTTTTTIVEPDGTTSTSSKDTMKRIYTPFIGIYTENEEEEEGGWAEYGPLFDGRTWNQDLCQSIPTICQMIQESIHNSNNELCMNNVMATSTDVWNACGSPDSVITILRLRPGTTLRPHCGTTNQRLILHFPLIGSTEGIDFIVGEQLVQNYGGKGDGHAIIFDDSYEHSVSHNGTQDRFIILAVLQHPHFPPPPTTTTN